MDMMPKTVVAVAGEIAERGEEGASLSRMAAAIRREGHEDEYVSSAVTSAGELDEFVDALPKRRLTVCHGAKWGGALDTMALSRIIHPSLPGYDLDAIIETLGKGNEADGEKELRSVCFRTLKLLGILLESAGQLPPAVVSEIRSLLAVGRDEPLKTFFSSVARKMARPGGGDETTFRELFVAKPCSAPRREIPLPEVYEALDAEGVSARLGADGVFAGKLPGYESRDGQMDMAKKVAEAFNGSLHLLTEAGTGTGKSFAYLIPSVLWAVKNKTPVVVSTNTKNLQAQLFEKDIPVIREMLDIDFKVALIKGRGNYLCLRKLLHLINDAGFELLPEERKRMLGILIWAAATRVGDVSEMTEWDEIRAIGMGAKLTSTTEDCAGRGCSCYRSCFLTRARAKSLAADLIVANHSLVFAEMNIRSQALPPYAHIVFDEAHNIEDSATRHFSVEISLSRLRFVIRRLGRLGRKGKGRGLLASLIHQVKSGAFTGDRCAQEKAVEHCGAVADAAKEAETSMADFFGALRDILGGDRKTEPRRIDEKHRPRKGWEALLSAKAELVRSLSMIGIQIDLLNRELRDMTPEGLGLQLDFVRELEAVDAGLKEFSGELSFVLDASDEDHVFWVEAVDPRRGGARAWGAPVHIGEKLAEDLYDQKQSVIFTSATLSAMGSFSFLKKRLGVDRIDPGKLMEFDAGTPFDYGAQSVAVVPMFLPEPNEDGHSYATELGHFLAELFKRTNGRAMSLFTSYDMLNRALDVLNRELSDSGMRLLAQGHTGSREVITATFKEDVKSVLMGTHSFWEGVDLPGETLSCLVVARLPFAVFTDPIEEARCERVEADGESAFMGYSLPKAVIRFRQGFGRLIRHRSDCGVVVVADRRIMTKRYGKWFRSSIPCRTAKYYEADALLKAVDEFLGENKECRVSPRISS